MEDICPNCEGELYTLEDSEFVFCLSYDSFKQKECHWYMNAKAWLEYCELRKRMERDSNV